MAIDPTEGEKAEREATMEAERLQYEQLKQVCYSSLCNNTPMQKFQHFPSIFRDII